MDETKTSDQLLPCPFCGGSAMFCTHEESDGGGSCHLIVCRGCDVSVDFGTSADPNNNCETLEELQQACADNWNVRLGS